VNAAAEPCTDPYPRWYGRGRRATAANADQITMSPTINQVGAVLAGFVEEVDAAGGPLHPAAATGERSRAADLVSQLVQKGIEGDEVLQPFVAHDLHAFFPDLLPRLEFAWPDLVAREVSFVKAHEFRLGHVP
jgi:hypothetical protein